ncbi:hypothetical protein [Pseudorhodobacter turbinis]|nr:hypothetical protein [Pseudorhodobacter turbinis]
MLVDFSALSGGGILGDVTWNTDIDTMRYHGDLVQTGTPDAQAGNDAIAGAVAEDFLHGSSGADILIGMADSDILSGVVDADEFVFADGPGEDLIVDLDILGGDSLYFQAFGFAESNGILDVAMDVGPDALIQLDLDASLLHMMDA